jgi:hypothetical protein
MLAMGKKVREGKHVVADLDVVSLMVVTTLSE